MSTRKQSRTMGDVSHTHPYDPDATMRVYSRGPRVVPDGGEREAREPAEPEFDDQTMADVSHVPRTGDRHVNRVFARGDVPVGDR